MFAAMSASDHRKGLASTTSADCRIAKVRFDAYNILMGDAILRDILIIFAVSVPVVLVAHRMRFPSIVGFLITGVIIGPHALGLIPDAEEIRVLAEVGVALLLFSIGLEFSFDRLKGWGRTAFAMGSVQVLLTAAAGTILGLGNGLAILPSVFLGCCIALSSTAIVMAILSHLRWFDAPAGRLSIGILIFQDLAVIPMMVILQFASGMSGAEPVRAIAGAFSHLIGLAVVLYVLSRWFLSPLLHHIAAPRSKELFVVVVVGLAIGAAYATEKMGFSFALGAFLAGLLVSTTEFRFHALSEIAPFRYCFNGLFFVALGMIVNPHFVVAHASDVGVLVAFMLLVKMVIAGGTIMLFGYPMNVAAIGALMLANVGEFSFMLAFFGHDSGTISDDLYHVIVDASAITMILAPFFVMLAPSIGEKLAFIPWRLRREQPATVEPEVVSQQAQCERYNNHAIICGFGPLGMTIGSVLDRHRIPFVIVELNPVTAQRMRAEGRCVFIGDGASASLLYHSGVQRARLLAIAVPDHLNALAILKQARQMNSDLLIVTRSRYRDQVQAFYDAGADIVVCEELEAGIEMGRYVLEALGVEREEVAKLTEELREFGSADFF